MSVEVANESGATVDESALAALGAHVLGEMGVNALAELSVLLVDQPYMEELHQRWMGESGPTDVLAFPMDELDIARGPGVDSLEPEASMLGDVVLCPAVAERQAAEAGHSTEEELHLLCTHGVLHLLGFDHADPESEREMFAVQRRVLTAWQQVRS
ncbi:MAG: rRNA maturation RNase YbeY [Pseudonocardiales bacterium]